MSRIVIGVACHKLSTLPKNSLYLPIHVGSALAAKELPGYQRDDEGDNISEKNPLYCEMTAQYWLWKNVDADYYGLCHYRRFINFTDEEFGNLDVDQRGQVVPRIIDDFTMEKYGLLDEAQMRAVIEAADVVTTREMDYHRVTTPYGIQKNVYDHYVAHDRALINIKDLDATIEIVDSMYPKYSTDLHEYLEGYHFRGFNCFVMPKALFNELCAYEFGVLAELEKRIDVTDYNQTLTRVYGFMAEILYGAFMYGLMKRGFHVDERQMLFFQDCDPYTQPQPAAFPELAAAASDGAPAVPIAFIQNEDEPPYQVAIALQSLLNNVDASRAYDILVCNSSMNAWWKKYITGQADDRPNVSIRIVDSKKLTDEMFERCGRDLDARAFVPYLFAQYDRMLAFDTNVIFHEDPAKLFDETADLSAPIAATRDELEIGAINGIYPKEYQRVADCLHISPFDYLDTAVTSWNLCAARALVPVDDLPAALGGIDGCAEGKDAVNALFGPQAQLLDQSWSVFTPVTWDDNYNLNQIPLRLLNIHKAAVPAAKILRYNPETIWSNTGTDIEEELWSLAGQTSVYHSILNYGTNEAGKTPYVPLRSRLAGDLQNIVLPKGSHRREVVRGVIKSATVINRDGLKDAIASVPVIGQGAKLFFR